MSPHTLKAILQKAQLRLGRMRVGGAYPSLPIEITDSAVMEDMIEEGRQKRGPQPIHVLSCILVQPTAQDGDFELWSPFVEKAPPNQAKQLQPWNIPTETGVESTEVGRHST